MRRHRRRSHAADSSPPESGDNAIGTVASSHSPGRGVRIQPWAVRSEGAGARAGGPRGERAAGTYFNPDEHRQCLEVSHRITFGYGHLTREWKRGLRSYLHPLIFAALYKILALLHLDTPWFMVMAPRLLQLVFASFGDLYLCKLSKLIFNVHVAQWTLFSQLVSWFMFFYITRTLSNSLETV